MEVLGERYIDHRIPEAVPLESIWYYARTAGELPGQEPGEAVDKHPGGM